MRAVVQRVKSARVTWDGGEVRIGGGFLVYAGVAESDAEDDADRLAEKIGKLRLFADEAGRFNLSAAQVGAEFLVVPQFTLFGLVRGQNRPSFLQAARPDAGRPLMERFVARLVAAGGTVRAGAFGAHMQVESVNDGPVTLVLSTDAWDPRIG